MKADKCTSCGTTFNHTFYATGAYPIIGNDKIVLNEYLGIEKEMCSKCGKAEMEKAKNMLLIEKSELQASINQEISNGIIMTIAPPATWDFRVISIVGSMVAMGTGLLSELSSALNDITGGNSNTLRKKLVAGERACKIQILKECFEIGGNCVVGASVDYDEIGAGRGMLAVKMAGTAIYVRNTSVFGESYQTNMALMEKNVARLKYLVSIS